MKLDELIKAVNEDNLTKTQLESYHTALCDLKSQLSLELASLQKEKAIFMAQREQGESIASRKASWDATKSGLRKFEVEGYLASTKSMLDSVKNRLYSKLW